MHKRMLASWTAGLLILVLLGGAHSVAIPKDWRCMKGMFTTMGFVNNAFQLKCQTCPTGKYQPEASQTPCLYCPVGQTSMTNGEKCWKKTGDDGAALCPPGKYGHAPADCKDCAAGRYSEGGSKSPSCSGLCRAGRYGKGKSLSAECDGPCNALIKCGPGAKSPVDGGACPKGRYQLDEKEYEGNWHRRCPLIAPLEFRPKAGYASAWGEQAACVLDKSMRFIEVLYALKKCRAWTSGVSTICYKGLLPDLADAFRSCCEGSEHVPFRKSLARCKGMIMPITRTIEKELDPLLLEKMKTNPRNGGEEEFKTDEEAVLPAFQTGIEIAKLMYDKDVSRLTDPESHPFGDLTPASAHMLNLCRHTSCEDVVAIQTHIERYYCSYFNCAADAKLESHAMKQIMVTQKKGALKKVKSKYEAPKLPPVVMAKLKAKHVYLSSANAGHLQEMRLAKKHQKHQKFDWAAFTKTNFGNHHTGPLHFGRPETQNTAPATPAPTPSFGFGSALNDWDHEQEASEADSATLWKPGMALADFGKRGSVDFDGSITAAAIKKAQAADAAAGRRRRRYIYDEPVPTPKPTFAAYEIGVEGQRGKKKEGVKGDDDDLS